MLTLVPDEAHIEAYSHGGVYIAALQQACAEIYGMSHCPNPCNIDFPSRRAEFPYIRLDEGGSVNFGPGNEDALFITPEQVSRAVSVYGFRAEINRQRWPAF